MGEWKFDAHILSFLHTHRLLRRYPRLKSLLEWEGEAPVGGRSFNPELADPTEAGALAAALWELQLLVHHYHPHVAQVRVYASVQACQDV